MKTDSRLHSQGEKAARFEGRKSGGWRARGVTYVVGWASALTPGFGAAGRDSRLQGTASRLLLFINSWVRECNLHKPLPPIHTPLIITTILFFILYFYLSSSLLIIISIIGFYYYHYCLSYYTFLGKVGSRRDHRKGRERNSIDYFSNLRITFMFLCFKYGLAFFLLLLLF